MSTPSQPLINAGQLDKRITLLEPVYNEHQDEIDSWQDVATIWAGIEPQSGTEQNEAGRIVATTDVTITIRYRSDFDARWRFREAYTGVVYEIRSISNPLRRGVSLTMHCREVR